MLDWKLDSIKVLQSEGNHWLYRVIKVRPVADRAAGWGKRGGGKWCGGGGRVVVPRRQGSRKITIRLERHLPPFQFSYHSVGKIVLSLFASENPYDQFHNSWGDFWVDYNNSNFQVPDLSFFNSRVWFPQTVSNSKQRSVLGCRIFAADRFAIFLINKIVGISTD